MFNLFKKKKKQVQTDEEGFVFSEFPEDMFKKNKKKNKKAPEMEYKEEQGIPAKVIKEVEKEVDRILKDTPHGMGFCHIYWNCKKQLLKDRGYDWLSPKDLNPGVIYD